MNEECLLIKIRFGKEIIQDLISEDKTVAEGAENTVKSILIADIQFRDFIELARENVKMKFEMDLANNHEEKD